MLAELCALLDRLGGLIGGVVGEDTVYDLNDLMDDVYGGREEVMDWGE